MDRKGQVEVEGGKGGSNREDVRKGERTQGETAKIINHLRGHVQAK